MAIEHFVWTEHARMRVAERRLDGTEIERAISERTATEWKTTDEPNGS